MLGGGAERELAETRLGHHERALRRGRLRRGGGVRAFRLFGVVLLFVANLTFAPARTNALHAARGVGPADEVAGGVVLVDVPLRVVQEARVAGVVFVFRRAGEPKKVGAPPEEPAARVVGVALALEDREDLHGRGLRLFWLFLCRRRCAFRRRNAFRRRLRPPRWRVRRPPAGRRRRKRPRRVAHADQRAVDFAVAHAQGHVAQHKQSVIAGTTRLVAHARNLELALANQPRDRAQAHLLERRAERARLGARALLGGHGFALGGGQARPRAGVPQRGSRGFPRSVRARRAHGRLERRAQAGKRRARRVESRDGRRALLRDGRGFVFLFHLVAGAGESSGTLSRFGGGVFPREVRGDALDSGVRSHQRLLGRGDARAVLAGVERRVRGGDGGLEREKGIAMKNSRRVSARPERGLAVAMEAVQGLALEPRSELVRGEMRDPSVRILGEVRAEGRRVCGSIRAGKGRTAAPRRRCGHRERDPRAEPASRTRATTPR